jgi:hypothetical protein
MTDLAGNPSSGWPNVNLTNLNSGSSIATINLSYDIDLSNVDVLWFTCADVNAGTASLPLATPFVQAQVSLAPTGNAYLFNGNPLTSLITGMIPRYKSQLLPSTPMVVISIPDGPPPSSLPTITAMTASFISAGFTSYASIYGMNLAGTSAIEFSGSGITAVILEATDSELFLAIFVDASAYNGTRTVTVTTPQGTSAPSSFFVSGQIKRRGQTTSQ